MKILNGTLQCTMLFHSPRMNCKSSKLNNYISSIHYVQVICNSKHNILHLNLYIYNIIKVDNTILVILPIMFGNHAFHEKYAIICVSWAFATYITIL